MNISVEFSGVARVVTKEKRISLDIKENTSFQDVLNILVEMYPEMLGQVVDPQNSQFYPSNMFNLNGKYMVQVERMHQCPAEGDRLILMSILAGG